MTYTDPREPHARELFKRPASRDRGLADLLENLGVDPSLAHATRLKAISAARVKTNKIDSDVLAMLLRADVIPEAHMISPEMRGPRDLMRTRLRLVEKCASCKNSIERLLEKFNLPRVAELDELYRLQAACAPSIARREERNPREPPAPSSHSRSPASSITCSAGRKTSTG